MSEIRSFPGQTPARTMPFRRLSDLGRTDDVDLSKDLVGATVLLLALEPMTSRRYGMGSRWKYQHLDVDTGEVIGEPRWFVSFAQPILRVATHLWGDTTPQLLQLNPPVLVRIEQAGETVAFGEA